MDIFDIINKIDKVDGCERVNALKVWIEGSSFNLLKQYQVSAVSVYRSIFNDQILNLYSYIFDGRANENGFADFVSNIILFGEGAYEKALRNPDGLSDIDEIDQWDDDFGINVATEGFYRLEAIPGFAALDVLEVSLEGVWNQITIEPDEWFKVDFETVKRNFPKSFKRFGMRKE